MMHLAAHFLTTFSHTWTVTALTGWVGGVLLPGVSKLCCFRSSNSDGVRTAVGLPDTIICFPEHTWNAALVMEPHHCYLAAARPWINWRRRLIMIPRIDSIAQGFPSCSTPCPPTRFSFWDPTRTTNRQCYKNVKRNNFLDAFSCFYLLFIKITIN